jgi:cold shock protein
MATGTVKWFSLERGYGFIQPDDGGKDVFVHFNAVERAGLHGLDEGQRVSYEVVFSHNGPQSHLVHRLDAKDIPGAPRS